MSEKDVKVKPKTVPKAVTGAPLPKAAVKNKEAAVNTAKDVKAVMKDALVKKAVDKKLEISDETQQARKAETEAAESVENAAYTSAGTVYDKSRTFVQNKVKQHKVNKVKTREQAENTPPVSQSQSELGNIPEQNTPKTADEQPKVTKSSEQPPQNAVPQNNEIKITGTEQAKIKTKEEYLKLRTDRPRRTEYTSKSVNIKTKENYIKEHSISEHHNKAFSERITEQPLPTSSVKTKDRVQKTQPEPQTAARREYVGGKLKKKQAAEKAEIESNYYESVKKDGNINTVYKENPVKNEYTNQDVSKKNESRFDSVRGNDEVHIPKIPETAKEGVNTAGEIKPQIKTKESYMAELRRERVEPKVFSSNAPKKNTHIVTRSKTNTAHGVKTRNTASGTLKNNVKSGSVYSKSSMKKKSAKTAKKAVKTQKEVSKKAAKEAAKRARQAAQKTAQVAKAATKAAAKIAVKVAQVVAQAVEKLISALVAAGGWAVLIVVLVVVIIIAALAASPFGIFISEEVTEVGTIPLSQIIAECNVELTQEVENIELSVAHDDVEVIDNQANWNEIIAVFATKTAGVDDNTAEDVVVFDAAKAEKLKEVFRAANAVSYTTSSYTDADGNAKTKLTISVTGKTKDELISMYSLTAKQQEAVETLLEHGDIIPSSSHSLAITDANVQAVLEGLPESLSQKRKDVIKNAASLVGKVNYFWGGKSSAIGWDSAWGTMQRVTAAGSPSSGSIRAFGLDCSGFVTWAFNNSGMGYAVGHGTMGQKAASTLVSASTVQAGDLAFLANYSHVGIVVGKDASGNILVIHCSSSANNVVLATASSVGFTVFRRPSCY